MTDRNAVHWSLTFVALLLASDPRRAEAAVQKDSFKPLSLSEVAKTPSATCSADYCFDGALPGYATTVTFTGKIRAIGSSKGKVLDTFLIGTMHKPEFRKLYKREIEVTEAGLSYWMPIQETILQALSKEVHAGKSIVIYYRLAGASKDTAIYLLMDFEGKPPAGAVPPAPKWHLSKIGLDGNYLRATVSGPPTNGCEANGCSAQSFANGQVTFWVNGRANYGSRTDSAGTASVPLSWIASNCPSVGESLQLDVEGQRKMPGGSVRSTVMLEIKLPSEFRKRFQHECDLHDLNLLNDLMLAEDLVRLAPPVLAKVDTHPKDVADLAAQVRVKVENAKRTIKAVGKEERRDAALAARADREAAREDGETGRIDAAGLDPSVCEADTARDLGLKGRDEKKCRADLLMLARLPVDQRINVVLRRCDSYCSEVIGRKMAIRRHTQAGVSLDRIQREIDTLGKWVDGGAADSMLRAVKAIKTGGFTEGKQRWFFFQVKRRCEDACRWPYD